MEYNIQPGMTYEMGYIVTKKDATNHLPGFAVLSTSKLIGWIEESALALCKQMLPAGFDTVGCEVNVKHTAPTPIGMNVRVVVEVTEVNGKMITFKVKAYDERNKISEGTHIRAVIDVNKFIEKAKKQ